MQLIGKAKLFKIVEDGNVLKGSIYFANNVGTKEEPQIENDFINCRIVGKAKEKLFNYSFDVEKLPIFINSSQLRNRVYTNKNGEKRTWLEVTIFDFEEVQAYEQPQQPQRRFLKHQK